MIHYTSASRWCKRKTPTDIGVDCVKNDKEVHCGVCKRCEDAHALGRRRAGRQLGRVGTPGRVLTLEL